LVDASLLTNRAAVRRLLTGAVLGCTLLGLNAASALAGTANQGLPGASPSNPLAGMHWGVYTDSANNGVYPAYQQASGRNRRLLAKIALRPLMYWFGPWNPDDQIRSNVQQFIANSTGGDPRLLSQVAVFRLGSWEGQACPNGSWSAAAQASYRTWIDNFASAIGSSRVALVLQPDLAFAACAPSQAPLELVSYAARRFTALPHTTVYIDGGVHYWPSFSQAVWMLEQAGIGSIRGFALDTTEYVSTGAGLEYGARIDQALAAAGFANKHFVINTAENGAPFLNGQYAGNVNNPRVCRNRYDRVCATLGIPPTTDVASLRWGLSAADRSLAARYTDAYLWVGRPWLDNGAYPFDLHRALGLAASSPW